MEVTGPDSVHVLVATEAKRNQDANSLLDREFYKSFLDVSSLKSYFHCNTLGLLLTPFFPTTVAINCSRLP